MNGIVDISEYLFSVFTAITGGLTVKEDVANFISTFKIFLSVKTPNRSCGKMGRRKWPTALLELISLESLVDLPRTSKGNVHILVINDHFAKLIKLYAIKDRKALSASACLHDYILTYSFKNID